MSRSPALRNEPIHPIPAAAPDDPVWDKHRALLDWLRQAGSVAVAYSGGCDSAYLLRAAHEALGSRAIGVLAVSESVGREEREAAEAAAESIGVRCAVIDGGETADPRYRENTPYRCYFCKTNVYDRIVAYARENGLRTVVDGSNRDDRGDHRPGREAAEEKDVASPLDLLGFTKREIRALSRALGLPTWDKPAAPCLASRVPYGTPVTIETLERIERAETMLRRHGLRVFRVRHHDPIARIEIDPAETATLMAARDEIVAGLKGLGYRFVALDLEGFRSGRLNEGIERE